jgi:hypothetical protein
VEKMTVTDNGHGMDYLLLSRHFGSLGGSWKKKEGKTGRQGQEEFSARDGGPILLQFLKGQVVEISPDGAANTCGGIYLLQPFGNATVSHFFGCQSI